MNKNIKKILLLSLSILFGGTSITAAQDVGIIDLNFCNGLNRLEMTIDTGFQADAVCMVITNKGTSPSSVILSFVEGEFSHGDRPVQACKTSNNGFFGQSVVLSGESLVTLEGGESITKYASFTKLTGFAGILHGCITYSVVDGRVRDPNTPMAIVTRKANLIDIVVPGEVQSNFFLVPLGELGAADPHAFALYGKEVGGDDKIKIFYNKPTRVLKTLIGIRNDGFDDEDYRIQLRFSSFFGLFKWNEEGNPAQLYAKTSTIADKINSVPRYHLFVKADVTVFHQPHSLSAVEGQQWKTIEYHEEFFLIPRQYILIAGVGLIFFIIFVIVLIKRKRRKTRRLRQEKEQTIVAETSAAKPKKVTITRTIASPAKVSPVAKKKAAPKKEVAVKKTAAPRKSVKKKTP